MKQQLHYSISGYVMISCILLFANVSKAQSDYDIYVFDVNTSTTKRVTNIPFIGQFCLQGNSRFKF